MTDDDLKLYDLSAWEAPPPPASLAGDVIARVSEPAGAAALEPAERSRRWWLAGSGVVAVAIAAIAVIVVGGSHHRGSGHGEVVATNPEHVELGGASADLEAGATVKWRRDSRGLAVEQRGLARWTVADDETLRIDAGAAGASVEATGASLRVEVAMNVSDARVIGAAALTAAAVSFVTVVVYEGRVKVTSGGQTVNVAPGSRVELNTDQPPLPRVVGSFGSASDVDLDDLQAARTRLKQLQAENERLREAHPGGVPAPPVVSAPAAACDEVSCVLNNYKGSCCAKFSPKAATDKTVCDPDALKEKATAALGNGDHVAALASFEASLACKADPHVEQLAFMAACNAADKPAAQRHYEALPEDVRGKLKMMCIRNHVLLDDASFEIDTDHGYLQVESFPPAKIYVDGRDTKLTTPIGGKALKLPPGKHKVMFVIGENRFTYPVTIKAGTTMTLSKDLR